MCSDCRNRKAVDPVERLKEDAKRVKDILQATQPPRPSEITYTWDRFKSNDANKPPHIIVKFTNRDAEASRNVDLKNERKLSGSAWSKVLLAPDLTLLEREYGKRLRKERDDKNNSRSEKEIALFRCGVCGNQVVKVKL